MSISMVNIYTEAEAHMFTKMCHYSFPFDLFVSIEFIYLSVYALMMTDVEILKRKSFFN